MTDASGLGGVSVLSLSSSIAGAYCSQLLAQAGADVTVIEPSTGHRLRRRHTPGAARAGVLFDHLTVDTTVTSVESFGDGPQWSGIDVVVADADTPFGTALSLADDHPHLVVVAVSAHGCTGPHADRPGNDFTAQAAAGALLVRGLPWGTPVAMGGEQVEWLAGAYAAAAVAARWQGRGADRVGDLIDVSLTETALLGGTLFNDMLDAFRGRPERTGPARSFETPSIEPGSDGYLGVTTNTPAQFNGFLDAIGATDLIGDARFSGPGGRTERWDEWNALVRSHTATTTVAELLARAVERRVPAVIVNDARNVLALDHVQARGAFAPSPDGTYSRPVRPWRIHDRPTSLPSVTSVPPVPAAPTDSAAPLAGTVVVDLTAWWAGPSCSSVLAAFGADVIHVEAPSRPDGLRMTGLAIAPHERWYDRAFFFHQINTNKRSLVVDATAEDGRALLLELIARADVLVENFTPRVLEGFGLDWDAVATANPRLVMTRLPAFGLDGPWREQPGFAQTMEQITGLAWVTGEPDDQPRVPRGPCDPNGGMHAAIGTLVALLDARRTGVGRMVESSLFDSALAIAAEQTVEWTANGVVLGRHGNRNLHCVPQGLYRGPGEDTWLAVSCEDDAQWRALVDLIGDDELVALRDADAAARWDAHDAIDVAISAWSATREPADAAAALCAAGVCAAEGIDPRDAQSDPQMAHRGFFEPVEVDTLGTVAMPTWPFRSRHVDRWTRTPSPGFGAHNAEILAELGITAERIEALYAAGTMSDRPLL